MTAPARLTGPERNAQILEVARSEFLARGFAGARVHDVAAAAGVTNALIYKHFRSKEELFERAVMEPLHESLRAVFAEMKDLPPDPEGVTQRDSQLAFVRTLLEVFTEAVSGLGVVLFGEREIAQDFYVRHIRPLIDEGIEAGKVNLSRWPHRDCDIETAVEASFGAAFWFALDRSMRNEKADLDQRAELLTDIVMNGVAASPH